MSSIARGEAVACKAIHNERAVSGPNRPPPPSAAPLYENFEELEPIRHGASLAPRQQLASETYQQQNYKSAANQQQSYENRPNINPVAHTPFVGGVPQCNTS
jgi:hypothetical protein